MVKEVTAATRVQYLTDQLCGIDFWLVPNVIPRIGVRPFIFHKLGFSIPFHQDAFIQKIGSKKARLKEVGSQRAQLLAFFFKLH